MKNKVIAILLLILSLTCLFTGCGEKNNVENLKVAFIEGSAHESYINQTFPIADVCTYNTGEELYNALKQGKIDAYIDDELSIQSQCSNN